jgi:hypothetical protein
MRDNAFGWQVTKLAVPGDCAATGTRFSCPENVCTAAIRIRACKQQSAHFWHLGAHDRWDHPGTFSDPDERPVPLPEALWHQGSRGGQVGWPDVAQP